MIKQIFAIFQAERNSRAGGKSQHSVDIFIKDALVRIQAAEHWPISTVSKYSTIYNVQKVSPPPHLNVIWWKQWKEYNLMITMWWIQFNEYNTKL